MEKFHSPTQWPLSLPIGLRAVVRTVNSTIDIGIAIDYNRQYLDWVRTIIALQQFHLHLQTVNPVLTDIITGAYIVLCDVQDSTNQYPIPVSIWAEPAAV